MRALKIWIVALLLAVTLTGCGTPTAATVTPTRARFFLEAADATGVQLILPQSGTEIMVKPKPVFTEFDIMQVEIAQVELGQCLLFQLTPAAARDLYRLSISHPDQRLVLLINERAMGARRMDQAMNDGAVLVFVETPDAELPSLAAGLIRTAVEHQRVAQKL